MRIRHVLAIHDPQSKGARRQVRHQNVSAVRANDDGGVSGELGNVGGENTRDAKEEKNASGNHCNREGA